MEDHFLIQQVLSGNTNAFKFLVLRYQRSIFRYIRGFGVTEAQAEEIAQDAFVAPLIQEALATFLWLMLLASQSKSSFRSLISVVDSK